MAGSSRPLVVTSVIAIFPPGLVAQEKPAPLALNPRIATEEAADEVAATGVPVAVVRLPPSVHGRGDQAFVPGLINIARQKGFSGYIGEGANRWVIVCPEFIEFHLVSARLALCVSLS